MADRTISVDFVANAARFNPVVAQMESNLRGFQQKVSDGAGGLAKWVRENERTTQAMVDTGQAMSKYVTAPIVGMGAAVAATGINYNDLEQRSRAALETVLGSAEAATAQMDELVAFGRESPFPRQIWIEAQQQLLGFGLEAENVVPVLGAVQDAIAATGGTASDIQPVVDVIARIEGQGRITGAELNRLGIRGIDAAGMIADAAGVSGDEIRKQISEGAVDADFAIQALVQGMNERFGGAAENMRDTWSGATDRVAGAWRDMAAAISAPFVDPDGGGLAVEWANSLADGMRRVEGVLSDANPKLVAAGVGVAGIAAAAGPTLWAAGRMLESFGKMGTTLTDLYVAGQRARGSLSAVFSPRGLGAAVGVAAVVGYAQNWRDLENQAEATAAEMAAAFSQSYDMSTSVGQIEGLRAEMDGLREASYQLVDEGQANLGLFRRTYEGFLDWLPLLNSELSESQTQWVALGDAYDENAEKLRNVDNAVGEVFTTLAQDHGINLTRDQILELADTLEIDLTTAGDSAKEALVDAGVASVDAAGNFEVVTNEIGELATEAERAAAALEEYLDSVRAATDPMYALQSAVTAVEDAHRGEADAVRDLEDAQENLIEVREDSEASARDLEEAELAVEDAQRAVEDSAWDVMSALMDLEAAALDGDLSFREFGRQLQRWRDQGQLTDDQAVRIIQRMIELKSSADDIENSSPYTADVEADTDGAKGDLEDVIRIGGSWGSTTVTATVNATGNAWDRLATLGRQLSNIPTMGQAGRSLQIAAAMRQAEGGTVDFYGAGGMRSESHVAQIAPPGAWRVWAEPETGGEAYIPLAESKRARSLRILDEVAHRFGRTVTEHAAGSVTPMGRWSVPAPAPAPRAAPQPVAAGGVAAPVTVNVAAHDVPSAARAVGDEVAWQARIAAGVRR